MMYARAKIPAQTSKAKGSNFPMRKKRFNPSKSVKSPVRQIMYLQRTIGNKAVQYLFKSGVIQAKHQDGRPGVIYEKDADRVEKQVMQISDPQVQRQTEEKEELQRKAEPAVLQRQETEEEEEEVLQGKFNPSEASAQLEGDGGEAENRNGMPHSLKAGLEALSGMDLSGVQVNYNASKPAQLNSWKNGTFVQKVLYN